MRKLLYKPSEEVKKQANVTRFISFVNEKHGLMIDSYDELYSWSIEKIPDFWAAMGNLRKSRLLADMTR